MGCLGVHFALTEDEANHLRALPDDQSRRDHVMNEIEERYFAEAKQYVAESDKAWDAMHRVLSDGKLDWDGGTYPLNHVVLGGECLYEDDDYILSMKTPAQVRDIASALASITEHSFRANYLAIDPDSYGFPKDDTDCDYTWGWFETVRELYQRAAAEGRWVLFTADQ